MSSYIRTFNRFELKYLLHHSQAREFVERISAHVTSDANVGEGGFYKVVSRYYDSANLACYWEKVDGEKYRRKLRVRTYGEKPEDAFVEIKQRLNQTVQKRRVKVALDVAEAELAKMDRGRYQSEVDPVFDEVFNMRQRHHLEPKLIVSYNRAAFFDRYKKDLRITIDRNIRCRNLDLRLDAHRTKGPWAVAPTFMVLEVKFNESVPRWICSVLNAMDLQVVRLSKYCCGIERMRMQERGAGVG